MQTKIVIPRWWLQDMSWIQILHFFPKWRTKRKTHHTLVALKKNRWCRKNGASVDLTGKHGQHSFDGTRAIASISQLTTTAASRSLPSLSRYDLIPSGPWPGIGGTNKFGGSEGYSHIQALCSSFRYDNQDCQDCKVSKWQKGMSKNIGISKYPSYFVPYCIFLTDTPT